MPRALKNELSQNQRDKKIKVHKKFSIKATNSSRKALIMEIMNSNNLVEYDITKEMHELQRLGISQYYPLKTKFENNDG